MPLVDRVVVIHAAGHRSERLGLPEVGARAGEHVRVPCKVDVVRRHKEVLVVAVLLHEAKELEVARGGGARKVAAPLAERRLRDLPEEGALAGGTGFHVVIEPMRTAHRFAGFLQLGAERRLIRERVPRPPARRAALVLAGPLEEGLVANVLLPQLLRLAVGLTDGALRLKRRRTRVEYPPEAIGAVRSVPARRQPV